MVQKKTYIPLPNFDYPLDGPIVLGSIITDPTDPGRSLNRGAIVPRGTDCPVDESSKKDWKGSNERQTSGRAGIWAKFVDVVAGSNLGVEGGKSGDDNYEFSEMETKFFEPSFQYIAQSMEVPAVTEYMRKTAFRKKIYMVTGLKTVRGAKVASERKRGIGADAQVGIGGAAAGLPIQLGPDLSGKVSKVDRESFGGSSDFVFAMRLREIFYQKGRQTGLMDKEYTKGAFYDLTFDLDGNPIDTGITEVSGPEPEPESEPKLEILGSASRDSEAEEFSLEKAAVVDEDTGEECEFVIIKR